VAAFVATGLSAFLSLAFYGGRPHFSDEVSYAFQARVFAAGLPWLAPPPVPEAFESDGVILKQGRWMSRYPPGFPLLLSAGVRAGVPWFVNPLAFGVGVFLLFRLGRSLFGDDAALAGAILFALSPFANTMSASFMSHTSSAASAVGALAFAVDSRGRRGTAVVSGLFAGLAFAIRPASAVVLLAPALLAALLVDLPGLRNRRRLAGFAAGFLVLPLAVACFQWAAFGSPLRTGYQVYDPLVSIEGNGGERIPASASFVEHLPAYPGLLGEAAFGLGGGALLVLAAIPLLRRRPAGLPLAAGFLGLLLFYSCFWSADVTHGGPRYLLDAIPLLALLLGETAATLVRRLPSVGPALRALLPAALAVALSAVVLSRRLPDLRGGLSECYGGAPSDPLAGMAEAKVGPSALVLVTWKNPVGWPEYTPRNFAHYPAYLLENGPVPSTAPRVFVRDIPDLRDRLFAAYPRAETWRVVVEVRPAASDETEVGGAWRLLGIHWERVRRP
jgi:hypothetical protein